MQIGPTLPPPLLQVVREVIKPGGDTLFDTIEKERARLAADLRSPHPYLGTESVTGSKEAWWFNGYQSVAEQQQVHEAYARNVLLMAAWQRTAADKASVTLQFVDVVARHRPDLSAGTPWLMGHGRFLVVSMTTTSRPNGTVFEGADGTRLTICAAATREEADAMRATRDPEARILAVRPSWSVPAAAWIAADPAFWDTRRERTR